MVCLAMGGHRGFRSIWGGAKGVSGRRPLVVLAVIVLTYGWAVTLCPRSVFDPVTRLLFPIEGPTWRSWGTIHRPDSMVAMIRTSALALGFFALLQATLDVRWRWRLVAVMAGTAVSVAVYGILQKAAGDVLGIWQGRVLPETVFASYWYHANAAAFLNLCWPLLLAMVTKHGSEGGSRGMKWFLWSGLAVIAVAIFLNISKAGQAVFLMQVCVLWLLHKMMWPTRVPPIEGTAAGARVVAGFAMPAVLLILGALGAWTTGDRWVYLFKNPEHDQRTLVVRFCLDALRESGWVGWGPGTFHVGFAVFTAGLPDRPHGTWVFAHNDYLQCMLEWGLLGSFLAAGILLQMTSQILHLLVRAMRHVHAPSLSLLSACVTAGAGILLHAAVDYPFQIASLQLYALAMAALALSCGSRARA